MREDIRRIVGDHYVDSVERHGLTPAAVGWPREAELAARFATLLSGVDFGTFTEHRRLRLLDLGCGPGLLLDWLSSNKLLDLVDYTGVDVTEHTMRYGRERWPTCRFEKRDVRENPFAPESFDICVACGVFTARGYNSQAQMLDMVRDTLLAIWPSVREGLAFNVTSKHVDWERWDLFHWPLDDIMSFCTTSLSRHVALHLDYGPWETAVIVARSPRQPSSRVPSTWLQPQSPGTR